MHPDLKEYSTQYGKVRKFSDDGIQSAIDAALKHVSKDKPVAVVGHVSHEGWRVSAAARIGDDWTIMAAAYDSWEPDEPLTVEGQVVWTP